MITNETVKMQKLAVHIKAVAAILCAESLKQSKFSFGERFSSSCIIGGILRSQI